jgi:hypothetical protein
MEGRGDSLCRRVETKNMKDWSVCETGDDWDGEMDVVLRIFTAMMKILDIMMTFGEGRGLKSSTFTRTIRVSSVNRDID